MESSDMNQITENLYLGNIFSALDKEKLESLKIHKVLTVMGTFSNKYPKNTIIQKIIDIDDCSSSNIIKYFKECLNFIDGDEKVLVHCEAGISRSATIIIAYIMWKQKKSYLDAYKFVKSKRGNISPNCGFVNQLKMFDKLLEEKNYDLNKINFNKIKIIKFKNGGLICEII